jgi:putative acetyltransferase
MDPAAAGGAGAPFTIRDATGDDSGAVREIVGAVLREYGLAPDPGGTDADLADLDAGYRRQGGVFRVVVSAGGRVVGCGGLFRSSAEEVELRKMYLLPLARGRGLGRRLLGELLGEARRLGARRVVLETASVLEEAIGLYRRAGFRRIARSHLAARCDQAWALDLAPSPDRAAIVRVERPEDAAAIATVLGEAFRTHPHSRHDEERIVRVLREQGVLALSLVAASEEGVVGHVAFSPVAIADGSPGWLGLGPMAVRPSHQRRGIGTALVRHGLDLLRGRGARGCVVLGEPGFYGRFGFAADPALRLAGVPPDHFLALALDRHPAADEVTYHAAFAGG